MSHPQKQCMSYESESILDSTARVNDVRELVGLLGYRRAGVLKSLEYGDFEEYWFFDDKDYRSWTGVTLSISLASQPLVVSTRTPVARSYYDLTHQNLTISSLRKRFGGRFTTDEGACRYLRPNSGPPPAPASGCHLAFGQLGSNLIKASLYLQSRVFPKPFSATPVDKKAKAPKFLLELDPNCLSNNMLVPFIVASLEDYFKSTFVALLRYSPRKAAFFKNIRLQGDQLAAISDGRLSLEAQVAEILPFQNISAICRHFDVLDPKLDLVGALRKPYRRRRLSLFDLIESTVATRHIFIHGATMDTSLTDLKIQSLVYDLDVAMTRVYKRITQHYGWPFDKTWFLGRPRATGKTF